MISYREKELLMVMKYMADRTNEFSSWLEDGFQSDSFEVLPEAESFDDIKQQAYENGYFPTVRINELLSEQELEQLDKEYEEINDTFDDLTKLNKTDIGFVIAATALQMARQYLQPKVNFDAFKDKKDRPGEKETADKAKEDYNEDAKKHEKQKKAAEADDTTGHRYYYAKLEDIVNIGKGVPYDITNGTQAYHVKISGRNHRIKTLGHDPRLGYLFGTCNILTNTMSLSRSNGFRTLHIGTVDGKMAPIAEADMVKMLEYSYERFKESKSTVALALGKQVYHIKSDEYSKEGLGLPFLQLLFDDEVIKTLLESNIDFARLEFIETVGVQAGLSELISFFISIAHRYTIILGEYNREIRHVKDLRDEIKRMSSFDLVRTKKIILISNSMASIANALIIGGEAAVQYLAEDEVDPELFNKLDIGGYFATVRHLFTDGRFICKLKKEYVASEVTKRTQEKYGNL